MALRADRIGEHRTALDKNRKIILATQTVCGICGKPVDFTYQYPHPLSPTVGQFTQQSMTPHTDQLRMFASLFAGETGLTLDDLGFATENPSSSEAIKAAHENLRLTARKAQRTFGSGFLNAGFLAACLRDEYAYKRNQLYLTKPTWAPIFEPDASMMSGIGDAIGKVNGAVPGFFTPETVYDLTGITPGDR